MIMILLRPKIVGILSHALAPRPFLLPILTKIHRRVNVNISGIILFSPPLYYTLYFQEISGQF